MSEEPEDAPPADGLDLARSLARQLKARLGEGPPAGQPRRRDGATPPAARRPSRRGQGQMSGAFPDERDPQTMDALMSKLVADRGWSEEIRTRAVMARWDELVGPEIAAHSTPESFHEARLVVRTDSTAWATELRLLTPQLLHRINAELAAKTVEYIEVLGPHAPSWKSGRRSIRGARGPRDTYG